jgi:ABC-type glycerol-3-phosphate transport system permease component
MKMKPVKFQKAGNYILTVVLMTLAVLTIIPFYLMFVMSTMDNASIFSGPTLLPGKELAANFVSILGVNYFRAFMNSAIVALCSVLLTVFFSSLAGFALAKYEFPYKKVIYSCIIATLLVPQEIGLVAYVWEMRAMGISKTLLPLILPHIASAFGVFWMAQYMKDSIPGELLESGRMDGCNDFRIFYGIVLPIIQPALFTLAVISFLNSWNNYMLPLVLVNDPSRFTIPLAIAGIGNQYMPDYGARILGVCIGILPILLLFLVFSKSITEGLTAGAVKG